MTEPNQRTVWITGAGGLIGNYLAQTAPQFAPWERQRPAGSIRNTTKDPPARRQRSQICVRGLTRADLDLLDFDAVQKKFRADAPQLVVHCAALSQSPECQKNPGLARKLNVEVTALLVELAADIPFIFFSTDLVFDGRAGNYDESAAVNPLSVYAETKALAEKIVLANPRHTVIRTSLNGGASPTGDSGFNEQLRQAFLNGQTVKLFTDEFRNPIPAVVTARAVWELVAQNQPGLYHIAGSEPLSRWELGSLIAARWPQLQPKLEAGSLREYRGAPRAPDTSLNCAKVQKLLSFPLPRLTEWLDARLGESF